MLPADVPLASGELRSLIQSRGGAARRDAGAVARQQRHQRLLLAPPNAIDPCYGPGSYLQHLSQAMARRVDVNVVHLEGLARDIDEPGDLARLLAHPQAGRRYAFPRAARGRLR